MLKFGCEGYVQVAADVDDEEELSRDDFDDSLKKMEGFMLKSGEGFKNCIFRLFSQVWNEEVKPQ